MNLGGIGSLASGLSQGLQPYFQQQMQNVGASDLGAALMSQYGVYLWAGGGPGPGAGRHRQFVPVPLVPPAVPGANGATD